MDLKDFAHFFETYVGANRFPGEVYAACAEVPYHRVSLAALKTLGCAPEGTIVGDVCMRFGKTEISSLAKDANPRKPLIELAERALTDSRTLLREVGIDREDREQQNGLTAAFCFLGASVGRAVMNKVSSEVKTPGPVRIAEMRGQV